MARIKIKCRNPNKDSKLKLIEILCKKDIEISRCLSIHDGFVVITLNEEHADNIFASDTKQELAINDLTPMVPPDLKARKSAIIPRVDNLIYENQATEIEEELLRENDWIQEGEIESVYKFPNSPTLKITFTMTILAKKSTEKGLKAFKISIPGQEIKLEIFVPIQCCMRCYTLEQHYTNECPKDRDYRICSECSSEGHVWHQCREVIKKCINCEENHSSMAMKCPKRKEILKNKRAQQTTKQNMAYSNTAMANVPPNVANYDIPRITKDEVLKINVFHSCSLQRPTEATIVRRGTQKIVKGKQPTRLCAPRGQCRST